MRFFLSSSVLYMTKTTHVVFVESVCTFWCYKNRWTRFDQQFCGALSRWKVFLLETAISRVFWFFGGASVFNRRTIDRRVFLSLDPCSIGSSVSLFASLSVWLLEFFLKGMAHWLMLCSKKVAKCMVTRWEDINFKSSGGRLQVLEPQVRIWCRYLSRLYHKKARCSMLLYCQLSAFVLGQLVENWKNYGKKSVDFLSSRKNTVTPRPQAAEW